MFVLLQNIEHFSLVQIRLKITIPVGKLELWVKLRWPSGINGSDGRNSKVKLRWP